MFFCVLFPQYEIHECKKKLFRVSLLLSVSLLSIFSFSLRRVPFFLVKHQTTCFIVRFMLYNIQMRDTRRRKKTFPFGCQNIFLMNMGSVVGRIGRRERKVNAIYYLLHLIYFSSLLLTLVGDHNHFPSEIAFMCRLEGFFCWTLSAGWRY